jgi:hypothetical protein
MPEFVETDLFEANEVDVFESESARLEELKTTESTLQNKSYSAESQSSLEKVQIELQKQQLVVDQKLLDVYTPGENLSITEATTISDHINNFKEGNVLEDQQLQEKVNKIEAKVKKVNKSITESGKKLSTKKFKDIMEKYKEKYKEGKLNDKQLEAEIDNEIEKSVKDPNSKSLVEKFGEGLAKTILKLSALGGIFGFGFVLLKKLAKAQSGCYLLTGAKSSQLTRDGNCDCCSNSSTGQCIDNKCCGSNCKPGSQCTCYQKDSLDVLSDVTNTALNLAKEAANTGFDLLDFFSGSGLIKGIAIVFILILGLIIFKNLIAKKQS